MYSNCFSDVLRSHYYTDLACFIDLRTGSYQDLSNYARVMTLATAAAAQPPYDKTRTRGKGRSMGGAGPGVGNGGYITTPHTAELNLQPSGTIACFFRTEAGMGNAAGARLCWKRGAATAYDLHESGVNSLGIYDGITTHALGTVVWATTRSIAASFTVGAAPLGYQNGVRLALPVSLWAPGASVDALYLANASTGGLTYPPVAWWCFLLFAARLTGAEIAQLHTDFMKSTFAL